ncbi:MAG: hypothetical protein JNM78_16565 [Cyclobacteriaceae bacterium]|nr:hypothetical protein [Cyclobacteriaceae bacterium]
MNCIRFNSLFMLLSLVCFSATAQFRGKLKSYNLYTLSTEVSRIDPKIVLIQGQAPGHFSSPFFTTTVNSRCSYWLSQMTTQTMNDGKMGTYYLWDQQGNLRESRFFVDIGAKNNPGLKLVFLRR